jgi:hypothetical protein
VFHRLIRTIGPITIADDRARPCPLVGPPDKWPVHTWRGRPKGDVDPAMRAELDWTSRWAAAFGLIIGIVFALTGAWARRLLSAPAGWPSWASLLIGPIAMGLAVRPLAPLVARHNRKKQAAAFRAAYIDARRCPSCGYEPSDLPPASDGCVEGPECNCAWRLKRPALQRSPR